MRCSLKVISLGKMRGVENFSKTKKELTAIGIIIIFLNIGATILPAPDNLSLIGAVSVIDRLSGASIVAPILRNYNNSYGSQFFLCF